MDGSVSFIHDTSSTISSIREILGHYELGFPLIKELIQNADDAGATSLDIGWLPVVGGLRNPLLQAPSLFVLNNGPFFDSNETAIRRISGSDKGSQEGAIGKFGRGLKSLFHLCEGFAFLSSVQDGGGDGTWPLGSASLLTPWNPKEGLHPEWDLFDEAHREAMRTELSPFLPSGEHWFCLWIPLRREDPGGLPPIHPGVFPGDSNVPPSFLMDEVDSGCQQTMQALPFLRSLTAVRYWLPRTDGAVGLEAHEVRLREGHFRRQFVAGETAPGEWLLRGAIVVERDSKGSPELTRSGTFAGQEVLLEGEGEFAALKAREEWPVRDVILGGKEKGEPHAAAVFSATPAMNGGELRIANAVFLPVGARPAPIDCPGSRDIELTLHAYSFVNSNRTDIERRAAGSSDSARTLKADWNETLRSRGVLPAVLPALDLFVKVAGMEAAEAEALTRALSKGLQSEQESVCSRHQWLPCLNRDGGREFLLLTKDTEYVEFPLPTADAEAPWAVFPALAELAMRRPITFRGLPRLAGGPSRWSTEELIELLESVPPAVFEHSDRMRYLAEFLEGNQFAIRSTASLQAALVRKVQEALLSASPAKLAESEAFRRVVALIAPERILAFDTARTSDDDVAAAVAYLARFPTSVVVLPARFRDGEPGPAVDVDIDDGRILLAALRDAPGALLATAAFRNARTRITCRILGAASADAITLRDEFGQALLLPAWVSGVGEAIVSLGHIEQFARAGRLLSRSPNSSVDPAPALASALGGGDVMVVFDDVANALMGVVTRCTTEACAEVLLRASQLTATEKRKPFLKELLRAEANATVTSALRYLLHGKASAAQSREALLFGETVGDVWSKLAHQALGDANWRFVDSGLADMIPRMRWAEFPMERIDPASVTGLVRAAGSAAIDCEALTEHDRAVMLDRIDDPELLRSLAMHRDVELELRAIDDHTYIARDFPLAPELSAVVHLLRDVGPELAGKLWIADWTPQAAVREALARSEPGNLARVVLDALAAMQVAPERGLLGTLRGTAWLPLAAGGFARPQDVVHIEGLDDHIARIAAQCDGAYYDIGMIDREAREHSGFPRFARTVLQGGEEALGALSLMIEAAGTAELSIGPVDLGAEDVPAFVAAFRGAPAGVMDCHGVVEAVCGQFGEAACQNYLIMPLRGPVSAERMASILNFLAERHADAARPQKEPLLDIFDRFLAAAHRERLDHTILGKVRLLNEKGEWRSPSELCAGYPAVDPHSVVHLRHADLLELGEPEAVDRASVDSASMRETSRENVREAGTVLAEYFRPWAGTVAPEAIGCFLAFLGGDAAIEELAQGYLGPRDIQFVRALGPVPVPVLKQQRFEVRVVSRGEPQRVRNLLGEPLTVQLSNDLRGIIRNRLQRGTVDGGATLLELIEVDKAYSAERLSMLLQSSLGAVVGSIYFGARNATHWEHECAVQNGSRTRVALRHACSHCGWADGSMPAPAAFWDSVVEQGYIVHLRATQDCLVEHLLTSAKQLRVDGGPQIRELSRLWEDARHLEAEARNSTREKQQRDWRDESRRDLDRAREGLRGLLMEDAESQREFLAGVRRNIESVHQYRMGSIPFELFQNADDAAVELDDLGRDPELRAQRYPFVVSMNEESLAFAHWGRPINDSRASSGLEEIRARGFHRDLEKMLMLGASDKWMPGEAEAVTGKFGLGFKSVFLLSDAPRILSGRLAVRVLGGVYPRDITGEEHATIRRRLAELGDRPDGTLIELPLRDGYVKESEEAIAHFRGLAPILVAFAKRTHRVTLREAGGSEDWIEWVARPVPGAPGCAVGALWNGGDYELTQHALTITADEGALLLGLGARQVERLPERVPGLWVVAPTEEALGLGFALNGRFELHSGRTQIASTATAENGEAADRLGRRLADGLVGLAAAAEDWNTFRQALALSEDASAYEFWRSVFDVLTPAELHRTDAALHVIRAALWGDRRHGAGALFSQCRVLPSELPGAYRQLVLARDVRFKVRGLLATNSFFESISSLESFAGNVRPGEAIQESVASSLPARDIVAGEVLDLTAALTWEFKTTDYRAGPEVSATLGALLSDDDLDIEHGSKAVQVEATHLRNLFDDLRFVAKDDSVQRPRDLVVGHIDTGSDEARRAAFAPDSALLSERYGADAVNFFKLCRGQMSADSARLVGWGRAATGSRLEAFVEYTRSGELRAPVSETVFENPSWFAELGGESLIRSVVSNEREAGRLLGILGLQTATVYGAGPAMGTPVQLAPAEPLNLQDAASGLLRLAEWWRSAAPDYIRAYDTSVYRGGVSLLGGLTRERLEGSRDPEVRRLWMELFFLGAAQTFGRSQPEQHRGFLDRFESDGWLDLFITRHTEWDGHAWIEQLKRHADGLIGDEKYARWMTLFVPLFQVAYRLDEYMELFLDADKLLGSGSSLAQFLNPATASAYSGGGPTAPPVRTALGIGVHFVLREMARVGLLSEARALRQCFVPGEAIRRLGWFLGCPGMSVSERFDASRQLAIFLEGHLPEDWTLAGSFDLPLREVAKDAELQVRFFGRTIPGDGAVWNHDDNE